MEITVSINVLIDKQIVIFICTHLYTHTQTQWKEVIPFVTTQMDLKGILFSEISQVEKNKCCMVLLICEIKKKKNQNS